MSTTSIEQFEDFRNENAKLNDLGITHGAMVYMRHSIEGEREVTQSAARPQSTRGKMTVEDLVARETVIERQEEPHAQSVSMDRYATNGFQLYASDTLGFTIERVGIMYGVEDDSGNVRVDFIYEPEQDGFQGGFTISGYGEPEHERVEAIAQAQGYKMVGVIFSTSNEKREEYTLNERELREIATMQSHHGSRWVTTVVSPVYGEDGSLQVNVEAFQCSDQCIKLLEEGSFVPQQDEGSDQRMQDNGDPGSQTKAKQDGRRRRNTSKSPVLSTDVGSSEDNEYKPGKVLMAKEVKIKRQDTYEVDTDIFLVPVPIFDHKGPFRASFPVENRLIAQTAEDLRNMLQRHADKRYAERLADFHMLLFIAKIGNFDANDLALLASAVLQGGQVEEGFKMLIDGLAGLG
jgi:nuclear protein localization family protein 4